MRPEEEGERERLRFSWQDLPLVTPDLPGTGGVIRVHPEDFRVEEIPAYLPVGRGSHLYLWVEKRNRTTRELVQALVAWGLAEAEVGVAGLKDKGAVTVQWLSVPKRAEPALEALREMSGVRVLETSLHGNKLGLGHLHGNRFTLVIRDVDAAAEARAGAVFERLACLGSPNYFGPQRFGRFGTNAVDGVRVLRGERVPGGHRLRRFFVSALQSLLFNELLAQRIRGGLYRSVLTGDWAQKHDTGGVFEVSDGALESPRAERLEISATLPLYGRRVRLSGAQAGELERGVLERHGLRWSSFGSRRGDRRISRLVIEAPAVSRHDEGALEVSFTLRKGSYATTVLRELMKVEVDAPLRSPHDPAAHPGTEEDDGDE